MTFADLEVAVGQAARRVGYVRDNVPRVWIPGGGLQQAGRSTELAGALLFEADEFFDRALVLFLIRLSLRDRFASTWGSVGAYYSNYFCATGFLRLHFHAVTRLAGGALFDVRPVQGRSLSLQISQRRQRLGHREIWQTYYSLVQQMAWPSPAEVALLAPATGALQYREQEFRERVNYRPGDGFSEIHMSERRYRDLIRGVRALDRGLAIGALDDDGYNDRLAAERLAHIARLMRRLEESRCDPDVEAHRWRQRSALVHRYAFNAQERRFAQTLLAP